MPLKDMKHMSMEKRMVMWSSVGTVNQQFLVVECSWLRKSQTLILCPTASASWLNG